MSEQKNETPDPEAIIVEDLEAIIVEKIRELIAYRHDTWDWIDTSNALHETEEL